MRRAMCPVHGEVSAAYQMGSPLMLALSTGVFVFHLSENPLAALLIGLAGLAAGAEIAKRCPKCGTQLVQVVDDLDSFVG
jgi:hypothetical protein